MAGAVDRLLRVVPPLRRSLDQVVAHAAAWDARNAALLAGPQDGDPLWVVLGDSTAQAVGLPDVDDGYVGRVRRLLEQREGRSWRVLNLSRSGARVVDLLQVQLPRLAQLREQGWRPDLVTAVVGGNDLRRTPLTALLGQLPELVGQVPDGTLLATLPQGIKQPRAEAANALLRRLAAGRGLPLADVWTATGPPWRGKYADGLHPNAAGTSDWVAAVAAALGLPAEVDPPRVAARTGARRRAAPGLGACRRRGPG